MKCSNDFNKGAHLTPALDCTSCFLVANPFTTPLERSHVLKFPVFNPRVHMPDSSNWAVSYGQIQLVNILKIRPNQSMFDWWYFLQVNYVYTIKLATEVHSEGH